MGLVMNRSCGLQAVAINSFRSTTLTYGSDLCKVLDYVDNLCIAGNIDGCIRGLKETCRTLSLLGNADAFYYQQSPNYGALCSYVMRFTCRYYLDKFSRCVFFSRYRRSKCSSNMFYKKKNEKVFASQMCVLEMSRRR